MSVLNAFLLGLIQGIAEFLPISSSGHLSIAQNLFGLGLEGTDDVFFDVLLHLGTLVAVFAAYWNDIQDMILEFFRLFTHPKEHPMPPARRLIFMLVLGTLPLFLVLPIQDVVESLYSNTYFIGAALLGTGVLLRVCDKVKKGNKNAADARFVDALMVGIGQAIATCPGISRSGMTISMGCFTGMERKFAVRFAFLLSIPAVVGANILQIGDVLEAGVNTAMLPAYGVGILTAAVSGYLSIRLVRMLADKGRFGAFTYYCWFAGAVTISLTFLQSLRTIG